MTPGKLSRAQRRRMKALANIVDCTAIEGDRRFFDRHRGREYRVRRASREEIESGDIVNGTVPQRVPGFAWFVAVRQFAPGVRSRVFFGGQEDNDTDVSEVEARWLYHRKTSENPTAASVNRRLEEIGDRLKRETRP